MLYYIYLYIDLINELNFFKTGLFYYDSGPLPYKWKWLNANQDELSPTAPNL